MLLQSMCVVTETLELSMLALSVADIFSLELFWEDINENSKRALQNIYDLDKIGQRKLGLCVVLYFVFILTVSKIFSPKKKTLR